MMDDKMYIKPIVEKIFSEYFRTNGFREDDELDWRLTYKNGNCKLRFSFSNPDINLVVTSPEDGGVEYDLKGIYLVFHNRGIELSDRYAKGIKDRLAKQLRGFLRFLDQELPNLPIGDFSWAHSYSEYMIRQKKVHEKLWSLEPDDPIYKKFSRGDLSWEDDILKLIN